MWFFLALLSAAIYSLRSILEKRSLSGAKVNPYILAFGVRAFALPLFTLPFFLGIATFPDFSSIDPQFWWAVILVGGIFTPLEMIFFYKALQREAVSFVAPLLGLSPIVTTLLAGLFFQEFPQPLGVVGMVIILGALYLLNVQKGQQSWLDPLHSLLRNKAFPYVMVMMVFYALGVILDKVAIVATDFYVYSLVIYATVSLALLIIAWWKARSEFVVLRENFTSFMLIGVVVASYTWLRFAALGQGQAGYVSTVLATSVLFSVLMGVIFLREKQVAQKLIAAVLVLLGLVLIKLHA